MRKTLSRGTAAAVTVSLLLTLAPVLLAQNQAPAKKIDINAASLEELQRLPRVGPQIAQRIIDFRKQNGKFLRIEDLMKVKGIGEKIFLSLKDLITVGPTSNKD